MNATLERPANARAKGLDLEQIAKAAPSVVQRNPAAHTSGKYKFIPTTQIIDDLGKQGWYVSKVQQKRVRNADLEGFQKHIVRFRHPDLAPTDIQVNNSLPELIVTNSHDGRAGYSVHAGVFRLVCANGMMVADQLFGKIRIPHIGYKADMAYEITNKFSQELPKIAGSIDAFRARMLEEEERLAFAQQALALRWEEGKAPITTEQVLKARRIADQGNDLWLVFNRVQENLIKGGQRYRLHKPGKKVRRMSTRGVASPEVDLKLNNGLWELAEKFKAN